MSRGGAKTERVCRNCGKIFLAYLIEVRRRKGYGTFCCFACYQDYRKKHRLTIPERNKRQRERNYRVKKEVLSYYSGGQPCCARCQNEDIDVLCLDHMAGGGTKERLSTGHWGVRLHYYLRRCGYPEGYQVLCANCNLKKFIRERR